MINWKMNKNYWICLAVLIVVISGIGLYVYTQKEKARKKAASYVGDSIFDKLNYSSVVDIDLHFDPDILLSNKEDEEYQNAKMIYRDQDGNENEQEILLAARGNTRKNYCELIPIRLKFPKQILKKAKLSNFKTLKLVRPCKDSVLYEDLVIREYLCYKIFETLSPYSFRVQMAKVNFIYGETKKQSKYAFLIEHPKQMAWRNKGKIKDEDAKPLDDYYYSLLTIFQYMIGNTDWNISLRHNIKVLDLKGLDFSAPIPFDFDYSGFVNANYAIPYPDLPISNIKERLWQWKGNNNASLEKARAHVIGQKNQIFNLITKCEMSEESSTIDMYNYISSFYDELETEQFLKRISKHQNVN